MKNWERSDDRNTDYLLEVKLCLEEMALDLPGGVVRVQEEVWVEVAEVLVEWGVTALALALVAVVSALIAVLDYLIKPEHPATMSAALNVAQR